jgi:hypothetical protein
VTVAIPDEISTLFNPFDDLKSTMVAPVPTNVPSDETPMVEVNSVAIPERFDPSP